ncbi:MAG: alpha/beta hydrolase [Chloroflexi bacterium]|nr:alpha/beta hydrolase [Chloroflexota bacterium]
MIPTDNFLKVNGLRLHTRDWAGAGQAVILVHGLASNAKIWDRVAPILAGRFRVLALDQRSHGQSEAPASGDYGFDSICADLHGVIEVSGFSRPVIVGHSWGASVALEYAARWPDGVSGVALVDGGFLSLGKRMTWPEAEQRLAPPRLAGTPLAEFRERVKTFSGELYSEELLDIILGNFEVMPDDTIRPHLAFENHMKIVRAMWEEDAERLYPRVHCPALFLPCLPPEPRDEQAANFMRFKREGAVLAERLLPQARIEWLADSIHDVPLQRPALVAEKVGEFVESVRGG